MNTIAEQNRILTDLFVLLDARERKTGWEWIQERATLAEEERGGGSAYPLGRRLGNDTDPGRAPGLSSSASVEQLELL